MEISLVRKKKLVTEAAKHPRRVAKICVSGYDEVANYHVISTIREGLAAIGAKIALKIFNEELVLQEYRG